MKNYLLFASLMLSLTSCIDETPKDTIKDNKDLLSTDLVSNQHTAEGIDTATLSAQPTMDFIDTVHNFGLLYDGEVGTYDFEFTNNGKSPLIISSAKGSCGCTVPHYPRKPIAPGEKSSLNVKFNSKDKHGHVEKSVTIINNSNKGMQMLYIKADVKAN